LEGVFCKLSGLLFPAVAGVSETGDGLAEETVVVGVGEGVGGEFGGGFGEFALQALHEFCGEACALEQSGGLGDVLNEGAQDGFRLRKGGLRGLAEECACLGEGAQGEAGFAGDEVGGDPAELFAEGDFGGEGKVRVWNSHALGDVDEADQAGQFPPGHAAVHDGPAEQEHEQRDGG
jgi:hypothetical protein